MIDFEQRKAGNTGSGTQKVASIHGHILLLNRVMPLHQIPGRCYERIDVLKGVVERVRRSDRALQQHFAEEGNLPIRQ